MSAQSFLFALPVMALFSCGTKFECDDETPCEFGEQCVAGTCTDPQCSSSQQCPIESFCRGRDCIPGCQNDGDCRTGFTCDQEASECILNECTETQVDCGFREFCNVATGDCFDAGDQYCKPCRNQTAEQDCGSGNECIGGFCGVNCEGGAECPGGFECFAFENNVGQIETYQCYTFCWLYEDYEPGALSLPPPNVTGPLRLDLEPGESPLNESF